MTRRAAAGRWPSRSTALDSGRLRAGLGNKRGGVRGASAGTRVATLSPQRPPARVDKLIPASLVEPGGPDPLYGPTSEATPRVLRGICEHGLCRSVTRDVV